MPKHDPVTGIPDSYLECAWRSTMTLSRDGKRLGVSFTMANGEVLRLALEVKGAEALAETIGEALS